MNGHFLDERNFKNYISNDTSASQSKEYFILQMMGNTDTVKEIIGQCLYRDKAEGLVTFMYTLKFTWLEQQGVT